MGALPGWCTPLVGAGRMQAIDRWAIEQEGVPGIELMERAGAGVARAVEVEAQGGTVAVVCGKGNNGGDGLVTARLLRQAGMDVEVLCSGALEEYRGDARANLERLPGPAPLEHAFADGAGSAIAHLERAGVVVDALLGTGFEGVPHGEVAAAISAINGARAAVVSVDVPSGVAASSGVVDGEAVRAVVTVTFHLAKPGHWIAPGKWLAGQVRTVDIGIPRGALAATQMQAPAAGEATTQTDDRVLGLIEAAVARELPRRLPESTKFTSGHVLVVGGSRNLTGAPRMTAHAALRGGAGYVTACVPASLQALVAGASTPEVMTRGLPEEDGSLVEAGVAEVREAAARGGSLAVGTGLGRSEGALAFVRSLVQETAAPLVLDADGLGAYAGRLEDLARRAGPVVLTPHAGELGRLLGLPSAEIERERLSHARAAAELAGAIVVLKGDDTLVAAPGGPVAVSRGASPALASGGTGDVLTGVIAALLAAGIDGFTAAAAGVWLHAEAGREAARREGAAEGVVATDVISALPAARARGYGGEEVGGGPTGSRDGR